MKRTCHARNRSSQRGSVIVETAIAMFLLLIIVFAIFSFGMGIFAYNSISNAAREGARYAIVHGSSSDSPATNSDITTVVQRRTPALNPSLLTVTTTWPKDAKGNVINDPGTAVNVKVQYTYNFDFSLIHLSAVTMSSTSQMIILQ